MSEGLSRQGRERALELVAEVLQRERKAGRYRTKSYRLLRQLENILRVPINLERFNELLKTIYSKEKLESVMHAEDRWSKISK